VEAPSPAAAAASAAAAAAAAAAESLPYIAYADIPLRRISCALIHPDPTVKPTKAIASITSSSSSSSSSVEQPVVTRTRLRSELMVATQSSLEVSKPLVISMNALLKRHGAPEHPVASRAVAELYTRVRQEAKQMLMLQAELEKKMYQLEMMS